jgi:hypothetical protein
MVSNGKVKAHKTSQEEGVLKTVQQEVVRFFFLTIFPILVLFINFIDWAFYENKIYNCEDS